VTVRDGEQQAGRRAAGGAQRRSRLRAAESAAVRGGRCGRGCAADAAAAQSRSHRSHTATMDTLCCKSEGLDGACGSQGVRYGVRA
jgi:hypothetical protein